jgi:uncharacterized protein YjdB
MRWFWRGMPLVHAVLLGSACGVTDTDEPIPVGSVVVTPSSLEITAGGTGSLDARVTDASGAELRGRRVVWASSNASVATVSANGVVTGVSAGRADIAATSEGKSAIATVNVAAAPARVASVRIAPDKVDLFVASAANLVATPYDAKGTPIGGRGIVWMTNNVTVAAVSQTGRVTALVPGTAIITAVIDGISATCTVNVKLVPVANVAITPSTPTIEAGKSVTLTARITDSAGNILSGRTVTWSSGDTRTVTVDQAGVATGVRRGSAVVTATVEGKLGTATVTVR